MKKYLILIMVILTLTILFVLRSLKAEETISFSNLIREVNKKEKL